MIRTVIIDDEPKNVKVLKGMLEEFCPEVEVVGEAANVPDGRQLILTKDPELVFLDIEMPYGNGFDLLDSINNVQFEVIFITAFDKYVLRAFKYSALDYLLKPVSIDDLQIAVHNAIERNKKTSINYQIGVLMENLRKPQLELQKIAIPSQSGFDFIYVSEIIRCEAEGAYTLIFLTEKRKKVVSKSIKEYENLLPEDLFFRIHHSHLVNLNYVKRYNKGRGGFIELEDGTELEVAARKKDEFLHKCGLK